MAVPKALVGFDGYIDSLYKVIQKRDASGKAPFHSISDFGMDVVSRAGRSGGFELSLISRRLGGNGPLMANAMASLGVQVACVGAFGKAAIDPVFHGLQAKAQLFSVAEPANTVALEFEDGKIMLGDTGSFEQLDWDAVVGALGLEKIASLVLGADLLALVNWSNMPLATGLWRQVLEQVLEKQPGTKARRIFFDFSDLTRCGEQEFKAVLALLPRFGEQGQVIVGANENEAWQIAKKIGLSGSEGLSLEALGQRLIEAMGVDCLVLHPRTYTLVFADGQMSKVIGRTVEKVMISTGAGDNFNAGFCTALLEGRSPAEAAAMAVQVSGYYVENGFSATKEALKTRA